MLHDEQMHNVHKFDWSNGATIDQAKDMISNLVDKLQQAMTNPLLHAEVQGHSKSLIVPNEKGALRDLLVRAPKEVLPQDWKKKKKREFPVKKGMHITMIPQRRMEGMILPPLWIVMLHPGVKELRGVLLLLREIGHPSILPNENLEEEATTLTTIRRGRGHHHLPLLHLHHHHCPPTPCPRKAPTLPTPQGREEAIGGATRHGDAPGGSASSRREENPSLSLPTTAHTVTWIKCLASSNNLTRHLAKRVS